MTDNEAPRLTAKDLEKAIEKLKKNGVGQNGCQVVLDANMVYQIMLENERLRRKPDPDTGLLPCGCGGSAAYHISHDDENWSTTVKVACNKCLIHVIFSALYELRGAEALADDAKRAWNKAMGWRVEG